MPLPHGFIPPSAPTPATATFKPAPVTQQPQPAPEGMIATPHGFVPALTRQPAAVPAPASTTVPAGGGGVGSKVVMGADGIPHITTRPPSTSSSVTLTTHRSATTTTTAATTTTVPTDHQQQYPPRSVGPSGQGQGLGQGQDTSSPSDFFANVSLDGGASTTTTTVNGGSMFGEKNHNHNHPTATTAVATAATAEVTAAGGGRGLSEDGMGSDPGSHALDAFAAGQPGAGTAPGSGLGQGLGLGPEHITQINRDRSTSSSNTSMGYNPSHPPHPHASSMPPSFTTTTNNNNNTTSATTTSTYTKGTRQKHGRPMCATVCFGFGGKVAIMMPQVILSSQTHHSLSSYPLLLIRIVHPLNQLHIPPIHIPSQHSYYIPATCPLNTSSQIHPFETYPRCTLPQHTLTLPCSLPSLLTPFSSSAIIRPKLPAPVTTLPPPPPLPPLRVL